MPFPWGRPRAGRGAARSAARLLTASLRLETLEGRDVPAPLLGLTAATGLTGTTTNSLVLFDSTNPSAITNTYTVTGLTTGDTLVGIDYSPTGTLYGVSSGTPTMTGTMGPPAPAGQLYTITLAGTTATATPVGTAFTTPLLTGGTAGGTTTTFSVAYNPVANVIQVVSSAGADFSIAPTTGVITALPNLAFSPTAIDNSGPDENAGNTPNVVAIAYTNGFPGATATTLYGLDATAQEQVEIGGPDGAPPAPTTGTTFTSEGGGLVGPPVGFTPVAGRTAFAFGRADNGTAPGDPGTGGDPQVPAFVIAPAATGTGTGGAETLYALNPSTALATPFPNGTVGTGTLNFIGLTAVPAAVAAPGTGSPQFAAAAYTLNAAGGVTLEVDRVGGATGTLAVTYATMDGTAVGGRDYVPETGMLVFGPGVMTRFITIPAIPDLTGTPAAAGMTSQFTVVLSDPMTTSATGMTTAGTLGTPATATVTISVTALPTVPPPPPSPIPQPVPVAGPVTPQSDGTTLVPPTTPTVGNQPVPVGPPAVALRNTQTGPARLFAIGAGPGGGPAVSVYDAATGGLVRTFFAFEPSFTGGVNVAVGDINGDGVDDIVVGAGTGGGPLVKVFDGVTGNMIESFFTFEPTFRGGVNVAVGDVNHDGFSDIITGAGVGGGPRVSVYDGATGAVLENFFAYDASFRNGVHVAGGHFLAAPTAGAATDAVGTLGADIATAAGPQGGPNVKVFSGTTGAQLASFFAYDQGFTGGVNIGAGDTNGTGTDEIVTGPSTNGGPDVRAFDVSTGTAKQTVEFAAYPATFNGGVSVAVKTDRFGTPYILTGPGPGGGPVPQLFNATTGAPITTTPVTTGLDPTFRGGINVG